MAESPLLRPPDADDATSRWSQLEAWRADVEQLLSDETIATWTMRATGPPH